MKITTDYVIGNTAIQIVNTGKRIKIVDVEKRARKKRFWKRCCVTLLTGILILSSCFYVVDLQNTKVFLDKQVYALEGQIDTLEKENLILTKKNSGNVFNYNEIFQKARKMGMNFPTNDQIYYYDAGKSTAVRINPSSLSSVEK